MAKKGGAKNAITSVIVLLVLGGAILGWAKANDITDISGGIDYIRGTSSNVDECFGNPDEWVDWNCEHQLDNDLPPINEGGDLPPINSGALPGFDINKPTEYEAPSEAANVYLQRLNSVTIAEPKNVEYNRSDWNHWLGTRCDSVREQVLREQAKNFELDDSDCKVTTGSWIDPYGKGELTKASQIDIDHVVSLSYAAKHGGQDWPKDKKETFANDRVHLLATSSGENRSKSDKGPADWMPKNSEMHCTFSMIYTDTVVKYDLSISAKDKIALEKGIKTC